MPNFADSDFVLFDLATQFAQNLPELETKWRALQHQVHPDKFASQEAVAQRLALQWSVRINEAYQRLKDPIKRAAYLCELRGMPINAECNTAMPAAFLMQQIAWREQADEAVNDAQIEALLVQVRSLKKNLLTQCGRTLDEMDSLQTNTHMACDLVRSLMFVEKFETELENQL